MSQATQPDPSRALASGEPRYHSLWRTKPVGAYYDAGIADWCVAFFERYCRLTSDAFAGHPFRLQPWQVEWIIKPAFGWRRADGRRLYRRVILWVPRKNGKTELLGGVSHLLLIGDGVVNAECYAIAATEKQAKKIFKAAKDMIAWSPALADQYEVFKGSIYLGATKSIFEPLTAKADGKHGLRTTYLLGDEIHEWRSTDLYTFVRDAMVSRDEPMEWLISTAGVRKGFGIDVWDQSIGICEATFDDPNTLVCIWCAAQDPKAEIDITDERVWREANPNYGVSVNAEALAEKARVASQSTKEENDFKRYHLNIWVGQEERWLPMTAWNECETPPRGPSVPRWQELENELAGRTCFGGLDLSSTKDINALAWWFPPQETAEPWRVLCRFWWPEINLREAARKSRVPFESWAKLGAINATAGNVSDYEVIKDQILDDCGRFQVQCLGVDQWNAMGVMTSLIEQGVPVQAVRFGMQSMNTPSKLLERAVLSRRLDHGGHPVLRWMAANVAIKRDANGNYMPAKPSHDNASKIDGIAATVIAIAASGAENVDQPSYLLTSPLVFL